MLKQRLLMAAAGYINPPSTGELWSWGANLTGQTAQGTNTGFVTVPTLTSGGSAGWLKICASDYTGELTTSYRGGNVTAIKNDGTLWGWGANAQLGACGLGSVVNEATSPTQIGTDSDWVDVAQGSRGGLAIKSNGTLWSWGLDSYGQLGQGGTSAYYTPTQVGAATTWSKVFTATRVTFVIDTSGQLWTFGTPLGYENGLDNPSVAVTVPTQVGAATNWKQLIICGEQQNSFGNPFALGLQTNGTIWSVGQNSRYQTGQGTATGITHTFTQIGTDTDWTYISGVSNFVITPDDSEYGGGFAIKSNGTLWSWGAEYTNGQGTFSAYASPTQIGTDTDWVMVCGGSTGGNSAPSGYLIGGYAVALKTSGTIWSWGYNENGQAGLGGAVTDAGTPPTQIGTDTDWTYIAAGGCQTQESNGGACYGFALK